MILGKSYTYTNITETLIISVEKSDNGSDNLNKKICGISSVKYIYKCKSKRLSKQGC